MIETTAVGPAHPYLTPHRVAGHDRDGELALFAQLFEEHLGPRRTAGIVDVVRVGPTVV